ncbi:hydrogenase [Candidatus Bathyarchaeota archaeon]|nr:MAG: hydrogenase [Candidatus Bathyarchaeota archaeon]
MGVKPSWFLGCLMLPEKTRQKTIEEICRQMDAAAFKIGVSIVGGHCEITPNLTHPLVIGFCAGLVEKKRFITSSGAKAGDKIVLTKTAGIEGTAILASDRRKILIKKFGKKFVDKAERHIEKISVVKEALLSSNLEGVHAMHDPTEGGILGGVWEIAEASKKGFRIYEEKIPLTPETEKICQFFKVDPLRLISSGTLLISVKPSKVKQLIDELTQHRIQASIIGEFLEDKKTRVLIEKNRRIRSIGQPVQDELWIVLKRKPKL